MIKFFRKMESHYTPQKTKPGYISALPKPSADKITSLFIQISSLKEKLSRYQLKRRIQETKERKVNILEILNKELDTADTIEKKYMALKSIFLIIQKDNKNISKESVYEIQQKIIKIDKEIESLHEHQRYIHLLMNREERKTINLRTSQKFADNSQ